ncbi:hypothetical protein KV112_15120 [Mycolicibacter sp. MYC123]|uniref:Uncharacterized protein n=1 Tax=[Mycobacterium] zoologicum TaxID=2872311 RepID=A0ABU5YMS0_9MYCO|nr:hypothetical protein [Mycolicibacter sp. MYC123]MEB3051055.1 hypothetical protein [Mycolicibacter sp. MYC123]
MTNATCVRWWVAGTTALVVVSAAIFCWVLAGRHHDPSADDCTVVAQVAQLWQADSARSMDALAHDSGEPHTDADSVKSLSQKASAAAQSVVDPVIRRNLDDWAQGFGLLAQIIHDGGQSSSPAGPPGESDRIQEAGDLIYLTADKLRASCPDAFPPRR